MNTCIYGMVNVEGEVLYVGQTSRPYKGRPGGAPIGRLDPKRLLPGTEYTVIESDPISLNKAERLWIAFFCRCPESRHVFGRCRLTNRTRGGNGAFGSPTSNSRAKQSTSMKKVWESRPRVVSEETRLKISIAGKGRRVSDVARAKISTALKGKLKPPRSDEHKAKLSVAQTGKILSEATKAKLSALSKGNTNGFQKGSLPHNAGAPLSDNHRSSLVESWKRGRNFSIKSCGKAHSWCKVCKPEGAAKLIGNTNGWQKGVVNQTSSRWQKGHPYFPRHDSNSHS